MANPTEKRVVIVGGGFGGLYAAKALAGKNVNVTLIDKKNHHTFQPLLYQVASGVLSPGQIASPLRHILQKAKNINVLLANVTKIDLDTKCVELEEGGEIGYDFLVVSAGARHSYFGHEEWETIAPGLKTIEDSTEMRRRILLLFEQAERQMHVTGSHDPMVFAIIGGGPTGVELAGAIAGIARRVLAKEYKMIDTTKARVVLFEGSPRVLASFAADVSAKAERQLKELGVEVHTNSRVMDVEKGRLKVGDEWVQVGVAFWATGVAASPLGQHLGIATDRSGRVPIKPDMSVEGHPDVMVIGDMSSLKDANGVVVPGLAAAAMQMGTAAGHNILNDLKGKPRTPFAYWDKGSMAAIGHNRAVAQIGKWHPSGLIAFGLWGIVHVILLSGFRNRIGVMREWIWAYITGNRSAELITGNATSE